MNNESRRSTDLASPNFCTCHIEECLQRRFYLRKQEDDVKVPNGWNPDGSTTPGSLRDERKRSGTSHPVQVVLLAAREAHTVGREERPVSFNQIVSLEPGHALQGVDVLKERKGAWTSMPKPERFERFWKEETLSHLCVAASQVPLVFQQLHEVVTDSRLKIKINHKSNILAWLFQKKEKKVFHSFKRLFFVP